MQVQASPAFLSPEDPGRGQSCLFGGKRLSGHRRSPCSIHTRGSVPSRSLPAAPEPGSLPAHQQGQVTDSSRGPDGDKGEAAASFPVVLFFPADLGPRSRCDPKEIPAFCC